MLSELIWEACSWGKALLGKLAVLRASLATQPCPAGGVSMELCLWLGESRAGGGKLCL